MPYGRPSGWDWDVITTKDGTVLANMVKGHFDLSAPTDEPITHWERKNSTYPSTRWYRVGSKSHRWLSALPEAKRFGTFAFFAWAMTLLTQIVRGGRDTIDAKAFEFFLQLENIEKMVGKKLYRKIEKMREDARSYTIKTRAKIYKNLPDAVRRSTPKQVKTLLCLFVAVVLNDLHKRGTEVDALEPSSTRRW